MRTNVPSKDSVSGEIQLMSLVSVNAALRMAKNACINTVQITLNT